MGTLYQNLMGVEFGQLAPLLQRFHTELGTEWSGEARITWCKNPLLRAVLGLARLPKEADRQRITVRVAPGENDEMWTRSFGECQMASKQKLQGSHVKESFGPFALMLDNRIEQGALHQSCSRTGLLGMPLPRWFTFQITAQEWQENERFRFDVQIGLANLSLLRYRGWLLPNSLET